jgi:uncharacterized protein (TIGR02246 family)
MRTHRAWRGIAIGAVLAWLAPHAAVARDDDSLRDRIAIQETLLYAYAYTWDAKDCRGWSNLFAVDARIVMPNETVTGRKAIFDWCVARQKTALADIKTRHNMSNIVFDALTPARAETRTYAVITWQRATEQVPTPRATLTYHDVIVKQNGVWLFQERRFEQ